jgi:hypothetical protein
MNKSWKDITSVKVFEEELIEYPDINFLTSEEYAEDRRRKGIKMPVYTHDRTEVNKWLKNHFKKGKFT